MSIERTPEDHARFERDMRKLARAKHTPGPWHAVGMDVIGGTTRLEDRPIQGRLFVCRASSGAYRSEGEAEANARLIAKAPEMLALLRQGDSGEYGADYWNNVRALLAEIDA